MTGKARINSGPCKCEGCEKPAKSTGLCSMHYSRLNRYGTLDRSRTRKTSYTHTCGYIVEHKPGHPLSNSADEVFQHRRVFYDVKGSGPFECFGCGCTLEWSSMQIDHKDDVKSNNDIENLRPACARCNTGRSKTKVSDAARRKSGLTWVGQAVTLSDLARIAGMSKPGMRDRLSRMSVDEAMETPKVSPKDERPWRRKGEIRGGPMQPLDLKAVCSICGKHRNRGNHQKCSAERQRLAQEGKL